MQTKEPFISHCDQIILENLKHNVSHFYRTSYSNMWLNELQFSIIFIHILSLTKQSSVTRAIADSPTHDNYL